MSGSREAKAAHYQRNKPLYLDRQRYGRKIRREFFTQLKLEVGCQACRYDKYPRALVIHHIDESLKTGSPEDMVHDKWSWDRIKKELKNCMVLCGNCHNSHHGGDFDANIHSNKSIQESKTYNEYDMINDLPARFLGHELR